MTNSIYGVADVARELGIGTSAVSNHLARHDTPLASHMTPDGRLFWDYRGLKRWRAWHEKKKKHVS